MPEPSCRSNWIERGPVLIGGDLAVTEAVMRFAILVPLAVMFSVAPVLAQTPAKTPEQIKALYDAHSGDFDYLLGDWEFSATSKEWGKGQGYWSAVRLAEGQVLDEYRLVGD